MSGLERARAQVRESGGVELLERLEHLDGRAREVVDTPVRPPAPAPGDTFDCDVAIAGGGLWSLLAPLLAARGLRVTLLERAQAARAHREWNASEPELQALIRDGLVDAAGLEELIVARYDHGICSFHGGGSYPVANVLDRAVDAQALLDVGRGLAEARGVRMVDGHEVVAESASREGVRLLVRPTGTTASPHALTARVMVDARGASSPYATADLVCPTVGGVLERIPGMAPDVGEILVTTEGIEDGRQHVWEAFPGRDGEVTVYLFYYALARDRPGLLELYARFFERLPAYKPGAGRLVRPTFGLIPGWSRLSPPPRSPSPRIVLVGDAAARQSPLTYCGFGAALRSFDRAATTVAAVVAGEPRAGLAVDDVPVHGLTGALAHLMATGAFEGNELNQLLDAAFASLHEMPDGGYGALLRDEMDVSGFVSFLRRTAARHPAVWSQVGRGLGPWASLRWGAGLARSFVQAARA